MNPLPHPIANYVEAANAQSPQRIAACFTLGATVFDEGHARHGRAEIEAWARDATTRYGSTIEPAALTESGGRHTLRAAVRGSFPGSPITLNFHFALQSEGIQSLEITP